MRDFDGLVLLLGERLKRPEKCPPKVFTILASCWLATPGDRPTFAKLVELLRKERPRLF